MACIAGPQLPIPAVPNGITLALSIPLPTATIPGICCLQPIPILTKPALPLGGGVFGAQLADEVKAALESVKTWVANLPPKCPKM